jgi:U3 small nucleolar RNA-associated protein 25
MGIQLNPGHGKGSGAEKGVYMRLFSDFFISDIILASPIGLRLAMGAPSKAAKPDKKSKDKKSSDLSPDFLSSVELVLLHQADVMYMQNWEHLDFVMKHANKLPTAAHDTDFSRVRQYFLEGSAAQHRQLIVSSHFNEPELQAFFREHAQSVAGCVRFKKNWGKGQLANVISGAKQVFQLVPGVRDFESQEDARFKYFKESVLAPVLRLGQKHTLIVTPSYLHYIRVRNELMSQEVRVSFIFPGLLTLSII